MQKMKWHCKFTSIVLPICINDSNDAAENTATVNTRINVLTMQITSMYLKIISHSAFDYIYAVCTKGVPVWSLQCIASFPIGIKRLSSLNKQKLKSMALCVKKFELFISAVLSLLWTGNVFLDDVFSSFPAVLPSLCLCPFLKGYKI